jgi:hypothetical protein
MKILNPSSDSNETLEKYNTNAGQQFSNLDHSESSPLMHKRSRSKRNKVFPIFSRGWIPDSTEQASDNSEGRTRSWNRRLFLFLTEPESSYGSAIFYVLLMTAIFMANVVMIIQTMDYWQFTPINCHSCGGYV